ncbi:MAG: hypothetical protein IPH51_20670 [Rubrivivax sp.]|nr:hypothetical protein [Rubrivivax sp.]
MAATRGAFASPQGNLNQHPGYRQCPERWRRPHRQRGPPTRKKAREWRKAHVVVTYDENGGLCDHARVPQGDRWGRHGIPPLIVSPLAR